MNHGTTAERAPRRGTGNGATVGGHRRTVAGLLPALAAILLIPWLASPGKSALPPQAGATDAALPSLDGQTPPVDTASLAEGPYAEMRTLHREGILFIRVDVLTVRVRFDHETVERFRPLVQAAERLDAVEDSVADIAARATDAFAEIVFQRRIRLGQFVDAIRKNLRLAAEAGYISEEDARSIGEAIPGWFHFLQERRIRDGDRLLYRIRGDSLRTVYLDPEGELLLDQTDVGPERRLAVLGGYFAPGADFREGLTRSLLDAP